MVEQLLLHLIGDYILQNQWMADNKTKHWFPAIIHAFVYSVPFLLIGNILSVTVIFITHLFIDRFRLVKYLLKFKEWNWKNEWGYNTEGPKALPPYMWIWLMIICDNVLHLSINYLSLRYL